jgi:hypothetical protein
MAAVVGFTAEVALAVGSASSAECRSHGTHGYGSGELVLVRKCWQLATLVIAIGSY